MMLNYHPWQQNRATRGLLLIWLLLVWRCLIQTSAFPQHQQHNKGRRSSDSGCACRLRSTHASSWRQQQQQQQQQAHSSSSLRPTTATTITTTRCPFRLELASDPSTNDEHDDPEQKKAAARVRFSATVPQQSSSSSSASFLSNDDDNNNNGGIINIDSFVSLFTSDLGSIVWGILGLIVLVLGRILLSGNNANDADGINMAELGFETRANILAVLACSAVLVNGVSKLNVESALAETVTLKGIPVQLLVGDGGDNDNQDQQQQPGGVGVCIFSGGTNLVLVGTRNQPEKTRRCENSIEWTLSSLLVATPAKSAVLLQLRQDQNAWQIVAGGGILPSTMIASSLSSSSSSSSKTLPLPPLVDVSTTPILNRFQNNNNNKQSSSSSLLAETYLPTLQALPGRTEFQSYLPENTQSVLILPVLVDSIKIVLVVLGGNQARSFTPRNIAWCRTVSERLGQQLTRG